MDGVRDERPSDGDQELVARICAGDAEALAQLYERHGGSAFALAYGILRQREAAEDAVQEAFLAVWRRAVTYQPERGTVRAWLLTIVRNRAIDLRRRPGDASQAVPVEMLALATADDPEEEGIRTVDGATVRAALAQWQEASRSQGLRARLRADGRTACADDQPGIMVIEEDLDSPDALAGAVSVDSALNPCRVEEPCWAFKSLIVINPRVFNRLSALEQANVIAHEIGHALGLGHAERCTGGTIMWGDTRCRFPLSSIGVDDVASLNNKIALVSAATAMPPTAAEADSVPEEVGGPAPAPVVTGMLAVVHWQRLAAPVGLASVPVVAERRALCDTP
ncbi:MAG: hypothetical protein C4290_06045 [Chloroflexota bacterium]